MSLAPHRRRVLLYVFAVVLPSLVLVGLALRGLAQERELAGARRAERRAATLQLLGQGLEARLTRVAAAAIDSVRRAGRDGPPLAGVAAIGTVRGDRLLLPWDLVGAAAPPPAVRERLLRAERRELVARDPRGAAGLYREVLAGTTDPAVAATARLALARALRDAGDFRAAWREAAAILEAPLELTDLAGNPLGLFAAIHLLASADHHASVLAWLERLPDSWDRWTPSALYLARHVADSLGRITVQSQPDALTRVASALTARLALVERMAAAQRAFSIPIPVPATAPGGPSASWYAHGDDPLMIGPFPTEPQDSADGLVALIPARPQVEALVAEGVFGRGVELSVGGPGAADHVPLAHRLGGLTASTAPASGGERAGLRLFYLAGLGMLILIAAGGAWLLWRDVRREVRLAELRSDFVANVSHELKTPLTSIRLFAETLSRRAVADEGERREYLETIVTESERLSRLLDNVLDFGRIERGEKHYVRRPELLPAIVEDTVRAVEPSLTAQGYALGVDIEGDLPPVPVDRDAIEQAILNLLSNAMKYSGDRKEIRLRLRREDGDAVIEVIDRGIGIPVEEQERIFERYYRVPAPDLAAVPGSGLGLTLVRHVAAGHGGRVTVQSAPAQGSTFTVRLPLGTAT